MKNFSLKTLIVGLLFVLTSGCKEGLLEEIMNRKGLAKKIQLKELAHNARHYQFTYDKKGHVDHIKVLEDDELIYTYDATYRNGRLQSAELVENGAVVSENSEFEFDDRGNITGFTYIWWIEGLPGGARTEFNFTYDDQNRVVSASADGTLRETYTYDNEDNLIKMISSSRETTFTYDDGFNPLSLVPDLFALMVEEHFFWELSFSDHNSLTRHEVNTNNMVVNHTTYSNEYDRFFRLIRKTAEEGEEFTFSYGQGPH